MAIKQIRMQFDVFFDEIIEVEEDTDMFDIIPQHMKKKYNLDIKSSNIGLEDAYELNPEFDIIKEDT